MKTEDYYGIEPLISIIIPVYNMERYLHKCIDSILCQTYRNLEILLIDDGSTDDSPRICDLYKDKDSRVVVLHKENGGQASARNLGLKKAQGAYIGFVDSDDWIHPEMYQTMLAGALESEADIVLCGRSIVDEQGESLGTLFTYDRPFEIPQAEAVRRFLLYDGMDTASWDKLFKKEILEGLEYPLGYVCEDLPFIYYAVSRAKKLYHVGRPLYYYLCRNNSTSHAVFSDKTYGLVLYSDLIRNEVRTTYRELTKEADYFYLYSCYIFWDKYYRSDKRLKEVQSHLSWRDVMTAAKSAYAPKWLKKRLLLMKLRIYPVLVKIKGNF